MNIQYMNTLGHNENLGAKLWLVIQHLLLQYFRWPPAEEYSDH